MTRNQGKYLRKKTDKRMEENYEIVVVPTSAMRFRSCEESGISKIFK